MDVNLCPLATLGTVEFRSHRGKVEGGAVGAWASHVSALVRRALPVKGPWTVEVGTVEAGGRGGGVEWVGGELVVSG